MAQAKKVNAENVTELLRKFPYLSQCYAYIRRKLLDFSEATRSMETRVKQITTLGFSRHQALVALNQHRWVALKKAVGSMV